MTIATPMKANDDSAIAAAAGIGHNKPPVSLELDALEALDPKALYEEGELEIVLEAVKADAAAFVPDLETAAGRDAITSKAYKITRTATILDDHGATVKKEADKRVKSIQDKRKTVADLKTLAANVKKPLTDWDAAQAKIKADRQAKRQELQNAIVFFHEPTMQEIADRQCIVEDLKSYNWGDEHDMAMQAIQNAENLLAAKAVTRQKAIDDANELARLRTIEANNAAAQTRNIPVEPQALEATPPASSEAFVQQVSDTIGHVFGADPAEAKAAITEPPKPAAPETPQADPRTVAIGRINTIVLNAIMDQCAFDKPTAMKVLTALYHKKIPHVSINY